MRTLVAVLLLAVSQVLHAQEAWPSRPVRIILSNSPGGSPDIISRMMADRLSRALGQPFAIENRPGGQSVIGADIAAKAKPDGYTYYLATDSSMVMNRFLLKSLPYDPERDFVYVANIVDSAPFAVALHESVPAASLPQLVSHAKSRPRELSIGITINNADILAQWINKAAGIDMTIVRYKENRQAVADAVAGRLQVLLISYPSIDSFVKQGRLRLVGVSSPKRFPGLDDVPALSEHYPGMVIGAWWAFVAPAGTPQAAVQRMNREVDAILKDPAMAEKIRGYGFSTSDAMTPATLAERARSGADLWRKLTTLLELKPE
jgi:tripartite-type tricarboxylate transporter receptor subunit TctC